MALRLSWDPANHTEMLALIQTLMDRGICFYRVVAGDSTAEPVASIGDLATTHTVFIKDPEISRIIAADRD
jgi:hypothetical protein